MTIDKISELDQEYDARLQQIEERRQQLRRQHDNAEDADEESDIVGEADALIIEVERIETKKTALTELRKKLAAPAIHPKSFFSQLLEPLPEVVKTCGARAPGNGGEVCELAPGHDGVHSESCHVVTCPGPDVLHGSIMCGHESTWLNLSTSTALKSAARPITAAMIEQAMLDLEPQVRIPLWCPYCRKPHVDRGEWATKPHHKHLCESCNAVFRIEPYVFGIEQPESAGEPARVAALLRRLARIEIAISQEALAEETNESGRQCIDEYVNGVEEHDQAAAIVECFRLLRKDVIAGADREKKLQDLVENLKQQARVHKEEAHAANSTVNEIYQLCTGATGEPGNWNGAEPVRRLIQQKNELRELLQSLKRGTCWCEAGIDNPNMRGRHSSECDRIRAKMENNDVAQAQEG